MEVIPESDKPQALDGDDMGEVLQRRQLQKSKALQQPVSEQMRNELALRRKLQQEQMLERSRLAANLVVRPLMQMQQLQDHHH